MKRLAEATPEDYELLLQKVRVLAGEPTLEEMAQAFISLVYEHFSDSLVLLRVFASVPRSALPPDDRQFVANRLSGTPHGAHLKERTPILALLGTRGMEQDWNTRRKSQRFRCIPLVSTAFVASLSMLSMQFRCMGLDLELIDAWDETVMSGGRGDRYQGMLYAADAGTDRDHQGRMVVPMQDFVTQYGVRTALGFGCGYEDHPTLLAMFVFTNEQIEKERVEPLGRLLEAFRDRSTRMVNSIFR